MQGPGTAVFLNGLPGSGKSTLARRLVDARPGWFLLDVDVLRTSVGGWSDDFAGAGRIVRPVAKAIVRSVVGDGGTVVMPQLLDDAAELADFAEQARDAGGRVIHAMLDVPADECWRRLELRGRSGDGTGGASLGRVVQEVLARAGGSRSLDELARRLRAVARDPLVAHRVDGADASRALAELMALTAG
ncbi:AAA family ATPase [Clavibacter sp. Sh2088]|uniref:AAA family ATPase n=1 Tax=Clavibacter sp. Sh2088 TaxID=3397676 RepID=UPI0039DFA340